MNLKIWPIASLLFQMESMSTNKLFGKKRRANS